MNVNITLHKDVADILERLEHAGFEAYAVGGYVRDALLGKEAGDCDITTNALPEQTKRVFENERTVDTGIKHGTVTLIYNGVPYEITTYRVDGDYADNRHPDSVSFTATLREDLARRDFTVNAMAYSEARGLVDAFGGREDLQSGIIRAVGNPGRRFSEDALRILRALRFASVLDFEIENSTRLAVFEEKHRLLSVSVERVLVELRKLVGGKGAHRVLSEYGEIICEQLRGVQKIILPKKSAFDSMAPDERLISIFYLSANEPASAFEASIRALHGDRATERFGGAVLRAMTQDLSGDALYELILDTGVEVVTAALSLMESLTGEFKDKARLEELILSGRPCKISELKIGGRDITALGVVGERVGEILRSAVIAVMRGEIKNDIDELLAYIKKAK